MKESFNKALLAEVMGNLSKKAFVASPATQVAVSTAQQSGQIPQPPPPPPGSDEQPVIGFPEISQMLNQGFQSIDQGLQQLAQMLQQIQLAQQQAAASAPAEGGEGGGEKKEKKLSVTERINKLEQLATPRSLSASSARS